MTNPFGAARRAALLLVCALAVASQARAGTPVRVFTTAYPPYAAPDLPEQGVAVRLLRELLEPLGYDVQMEFQPWARLGTELKGGRFDLVLLPWPAEVRRHGLIGGEPLFGSRLGLFVRRSRWQAGGLPLARASGWRVGVVRDYGYPRQLYDHGLHLEVTNSDEQNLRKLAAGRIDAVVLERAVGMHLLRQAGLSGGDIVWQEPAFSVEPMYAAVVRGRPVSEALQRDLAGAIKAYKADGRLAALLKAHDLDPAP